MTPEDRNLLEQGMREDLSTLEYYAQKVLKGAIEMGSEDQVSVAHMILGTILVANRNLDLIEARRNAENHKPKDTTAPSPAPVTGQATGPALVPDKES